MKHQWKCPECGKGVLLGSRPRKNATARFCLACSERTGTLVERICPALEKQRAGKRDAREQKRKKESDRQREAETISGIHIPSELRTMCRKLQRARVFPSHMVRPDDLDLKLTVVRAKRRTRSVCNPEAWQRWLDQQEMRASGRACSWWVKLRAGCRTPRHRLLALMLHELCHVAAPVSSSHDDRFATLLSEGARELWGITLDTIHRDTYDLDRELENKLEEKLKAEGQEVG